MTKDSSPLLGFEGSNAGKTPHRCPICQGHGMVPGGFFEVTPGVSSWSASTIADTCRPCKGTGIIYVTQTCATGGCNRRDKIMEAGNQTGGQPQGGSDAELVVGSRWIVNYGQSTSVVSVLSIFADRVYWKSEQDDLQQIDSQTEFLYGARCAMPLPPVPLPWWKRIFKAND